MLSEGESLVSLSVQRITLELQDEVEIKLVRSPSEEEEKVRRWPARRSLECRSFGIRTFLGSKIASSPSAVDLQRPWDLFATSKVSLKERARYFHVL